jgi:chemotaxis protein MotB
MMVRRIFMVLIAAQLLAGCTTPSPDSKAAKEFATQKEGVCCYVGMKKLPDEAAAKAAQYPDLSGQLADANRNLANKERENADLARQLAALKAALAAKEAENAELAKQLAAFKTRPAPFAQLLEREYFDSGSAKLKPEGVKKLKQLSADLKAKAGADKDIRIEGHTDDRPIHTAQFPSNWELSSARANAVVRELHDDGINGEQLLAVGYGASRPAAPNTSAESRAKNRRVEIILAPALAAPAQLNQ